MKFNIYETVKGRIRCRIEEDYPEVGSYLYIFENGECVQDYLQNNTDECKKIALEDYNIEIESWTLLE